MELAEQFEPIDRLPATALMRLAATNRVLADRMLTDAGWSADGSGLGFDEIDPAVRRDASLHARKAGDYFARHAESVQGNPVEDDEWKQSTLAAADSYDLAGYADLAIARFKAYVTGRPEEDPERVVAMFRMAQSYQALREWQEAAGWYEKAIELNPRSAVAAASHVPLAACYEALGQPARAEQQLLRVVSGGETLNPEAVDYRNAIIALGTHYYNQGEYTRAIEELTKAAAYYPDDRAIAEVRFRLADSYRAAAASIRANLAEGSLPRSIEVENEAMQQQHLGEAIMLFTQAIDEYERRGVSQLDALQADYLRLGHLFRAHCSYDLGDYGTAIDRYDQTARRYADDPVSLIALIQIVNSYMELGAHDKAATAHNRALLRLSQLPDGAIASGDAVLDEAAWQRWLEGLPPGTGISLGAQN